jgi:hypothetical protein
MGRHVQFGPAIETRVRSLAEQGRTIEQITEQLAADGVKPVPSRGWIGGRVRGITVSSRDVGGVEACMGGDSGVAVASLQRQLEALEKLLKAASDDEDLKSVTAITRSMNATLALLAKLQPAPKGDSDADPVTIADAEEVRRKLSELVDKALGRKAGT